MAVPKKEAGGKRQQRSRLCSGEVAPRLAYMLCGCTLSAISRGLRGHSRQQGVRHWEFDRASKQIAPLEPDPLDCGLHGRLCARAEAIR